MDSEKSQEQLEKDSTVSTEQSENNEDKKLSYEDLEKSYKYTQSELSKSKERLSTFEKQGNEVDEAKQKVEQAEKADKIREEEGVFNTFKTDFSALSETQLKIIRDLQAAEPTKTYEEVAKTYNMLNEAQLAKSKNGRQIMGNNIWVGSKEVKEKAVISDKARRVHNIKSPEKLAEIKESFWL